MFIRNKLQKQNHGLPRLNIEFIIDKVTAKNNIIGLISVQNNGSLVPFFVDGCWNRKYLIKLRVKLLSRDNRKSEYDVVELIKTS